MKIDGGTPPNYDYVKFLMKRNYFYLFFFELLNYNFFNFRIICEFIHFFYTIFFHFYRRVGLLSEFSFKLYTYIGGRRKGKRYPIVCERLVPLSRRICFGNHKWYPLAQRLDHLNKCHIMTFSRQRAHPFFYTCFLDGSP